MSNLKPIGIFDSGVGGLTIAKEIKKILPCESMIYYGDSKHLPYGNKSPEVIKQYSVNITQFLIEQGCKAIVIACNTASSNAFHEIKEITDKYGIPLLDVISPVAEKASYGFHQNMGVIATKATVDSGIYKKTIRKYNKHIKVQEMATPLLVPVIEEGLTNTEISKAVIKNYLSSRKLKEIDSIILGCTHYPLIQKEIKEYYEGKVEVINSPLAVAHALQQIIIKNNLQSVGKSTYTFYVSDITQNFKRMSKKFFGKEIELELQPLH